VINPTIRRELARQREADFRRDADLARRSAHVKRELPTPAVLTSVLAALEGLGSLVRRRPQPSA
jgi:hypothetical protein